MKTGPVQHGVHHRAPARENLNQQLPDLGHSFPKERGKDLYMKEIVTAFTFSVWKW